MGMGQSVISCMIKNWFVIKLTLQSDKHNYICSNAGAGIVLALRLMQHTRRSGVAWTNAESSHGLVLVRGFIFIHVQVLLHVERCR